MRSLKDLISSFLGPLPDEELERERQEARSRIRQVRHELRVIEHEREAKVEEARRTIETANPEDMPLSLAGFMRSMGFEGWEESGEDGERRD